jgi:hypothetical protein
MDETIKLLDVVALPEDIPEERLVRGQVGTVVLVHKPGIYEVEFIYDDGSTYAMLPLRAEQLMLLHFLKHPAKAES